MTELEQIIREVVSKSPFKLVISNPVSKEQEFNKVVIRKLRSDKKQQCEQSCYQIERFTKTQAFHINIEERGLEEAICTYLGVDFRQMNAWCENEELDVKLSKKGKVLVNRRRSANQITYKSHNEQKQYILNEGDVIPAFVDLGIFTKDYKIVKSMYDKFRQINRFIELVNDVLKHEKKEELRIIDFGCGKSYLTFILYYYLIEVKGIKADIIGLDLKPGVIETCNATAKKYGYDHLHFELGDINGYQSDKSVDMVITLHACDTATDYALYNAITWNARYILSVPCCQHELNKQIATDELALLTRYGIIKERIAALTTDAIRANLLTYSGYKTQVLEFVDLAHSPKNLMLRCIKSDVSEEKKQNALKEVQTVCEEFSLEPTLKRLLEV